MRGSSSWAPAEISRFLSQISCRVWGVMLPVRWAWSSTLGRALVKEVSAGVSIVGCELVWVSFSARGSCSGCLVANGG